MTPAEACAVSKRLARTSFRRQLLVQRWRCSSGNVRLSTILMNFLSFAVVISEAVEYCQFETFNATCPADHVIMMEHAQYGRPHTGRCIARDYGYVGCSMSVVHLLDRICSGPAV